MSNKLKTIQLCQLRPSKTNVRKTNPGVDIEELAASIEAIGLLENLLVKRRNAEDDTYEVVAGGRRLAALKLLAKRKKLDRDHRVSCLVVHADDAVEVSLAENFVRLPLHPADQCDAFAALCRDGKSADEIASRFGITVRFVQQRLKLAAVSPQLIAEYRAGAMTLEQLTAFTVSDDHVAQEQVWAGRTDNDLPDYAIRRLLTRAQVEGNDRRARFIGAKAFEQAGGIVVRDLFDTEDEGYFTDNQLLDRLVAEKLGTIADEVRTEGWHWVEVHADPDLFHLGRFGRAGTCEIRLSKPEEKRLSQLSARYDELVTALDDEDETADTTELDRVSGEIAQLQQKKEGWLDEEKAQAGAIVSLGPDGEPQIFRGLLRPGHAGHDAAQGEEQPQKRSRTNGYSDSVLLDLSAHRTAALRELVAQQPDTALLALLHALVDRLFYDGSPRSCLSVGASAIELERASQSVADSTAGQAFLVRHKSWADRMPEQEQCWAWLAGLDNGERVSLLAHCVSMTVNALESRQALAPENAMRLAQAAGLDMHSWWRPTAENFLGRLTKNEILAAVSEGVSQQASWRLAGLKKDRMAKAAEKLLVGSGWLPAPFRQETQDAERAAAE
jgi:ParB family chromosome partitioning protein